MAYAVATINGVLCLVDTADPNTPITNVAGEGGDIVAYNANALRALYALSGVVYSDGSGNVSALDPTNWNAAYGWGDHAEAGYLTSYTETDPVFLASVAAGIESTDIANWDTAYGWGNHAGLYDTAGLASTVMNLHLASYDHALILSAVQVETDPVFAASPAAGIDADDVSHWNAAYGWGNHNGLYDLSGMATAAVESHESTYNHSLIATALQSETDPVFLASVAAGIDADDVSHWNTVYGWGNHASAGYLTSYTETDPVFLASASAGITATHVTQWNTAYSWGNHAGLYDAAGTATSAVSSHESAFNHSLIATALQSETDPVFSASTAAGIDSADVTNWNTAHGWGNHATAGYLTSFTETDPVFAAWLATNPVLISRKLVVSVGTTQFDTLKVVDGYGSNSISGLGMNIARSIAYFGNEQVGGQFRIKGDGFYLLDATNTTARLYSALGATYIGGFTGAAWGNKGLIVSHDAGAASVTCATASGATRGLAVSTTKTGASGTVFSCDNTLTVLDSVAGWVYSNYYVTRISGTTSASRVLCFYARPDHRSSGDVGAIDCFVTEPYWEGSASGAVGAVRGLYCASGYYSPTTTAVVTDWQQIRIDNPAAGLNKCGIYISPISATGTAYAIYSLGGSWALHADNQRLYFGAADDAALYYDGTNLVANPKVVGSGRLAVAGDVAVDASSAFYMGDPGTDGTWRIARSGNNLVMQRRESGTYTTKSTINA